MPPLALLKVWEVSAEVRLTWNRCNKAEIHRHSFFTYVNTKRKDKEAPQILPPRSKFEYIFLKLAKQLKLSLT